MNTQQPSRPVITPAMREQASKQPNTWLYVVDPIFSDPSAEVPPWGFIGGYRVDERGELTDDFSPNPNYRPSPVALRLPAPTNDVERALQLTTTGYAQAATLLSALLDAELILFAQPQGSGLFTVDHDSGRRQLQLFTSESFLPANWTSWQRLTGRQLVERNPVGMDLQINPTSAVKARLPAEDLIKTAGVRVAPAAQPEETQPAQVPGGQATGGQQQAPDPISSDFGQRFIGSVLAAAAGDALGAPVEFYPVEQIRNRFGEHGVTDYDRSGSHPGEFTDDTQLAMFTLEGLIRGHIAARGGAGSGPLAAIQLAYQRWLHTQGYAWSRAAGPYAQSHPEPDGLLAGVRELFAVRSPNSDCITALRGFASTGVPGTFERAINDSDDNTGVVRAAPIALWSDEPREVFRLAAAAAALTCSKPSGYLPAGVLAVLVHRLLRGESLTDALAHAHKLLTECTGHQQTERLLLVAEDLAARGEPTPEQVKDLLGDGWSGHEALAIAVCAALSSDGVGPAVMAAVNHSGDSDSTAAICGAIVGAQHGVSAVPGVWLRDLRLRETVQSLAADALVEFGPQPRGDETWSQRYPGERDVIGLEFGSELPRVAGQDAEEPAGQDETAAQDSAPDTAEEQTAEQDAIPVARLSVPGAQPSETGAASAEQQDASPAASGSAESATQQGETADRSSAETDSAQQASPERADPATTPEQATAPAAGPSTADGAAEPQPAAASGTAASDTAASDDAASEDAESAAEPIVPTMGSWPAPSKTAPAREQKPAHDTERAEPGGERILGCLLGTAIGDALGYPVADESIEVIRRNYGGAGVADLVGHAISANTQLSLFTAEGLIRAGIRNRLHGDTDPAQPVQHAYQRWLHTQGVDWADAGGPIADIPPNGWLIREKGLFARRSPDDTCLQALRGYAGGTALGTLTNRLNDAKGSGGVVRAAPAGFRTGDPAETFQTGAAIAALTHGHPSGFLPAGALAVVVSQLLAGRSLPESVDRALTELSTWEGHEETSATLRRAIELATEGTPTPEQIQHRLGAGRVGEQALAIAVCAALARPSSFADAVVLAANHSGDSAATAAVCGSIMGAAHSAEAVPQSWRRKVELGDVVEQLARDAVEEFGANPPAVPEWLSRYPAGPAAPIASPVSARVAAAEQSGESASGAESGAGAAPDAGSGPAAGASPAADAASVAGSASAADSAPTAGSASAADSATGTGRSADTGPSADAGESADAATSSNSETDPATGSESAAPSTGSAAAASVSTSAAAQTAADSPAGDAKRDETATGAASGGTAAQLAATQLAAGNGTDDSSGEQDTAQRPGSGPDAASGRRPGSDQGPGSTPGIGQGAVSGPHFGTGQGSMAEERDSDRQDQAGQPDAERHDAAEQHSAAQAAAEISAAEQPAESAPAQPAADQQATEARTQARSERTATEPPTAEPIAQESAAAQQPPVTTASALAHEPAATSQAARGSAAAQEPAAAQDFATTRQFAATEQPAANGQPATTADPAESEPVQQQPAAQDPEPARSPAAARVPGAPTSATPTSAAETPAAETPATEAPAAETSQESSSDDGDGLSHEELRLLAAWRKFRDGEDDTPNDLSEGLHKLLQEAFGAERAAQLVASGDEDGELPEETPQPLTRLDRLAGCALGCAAGDALGAPWTYTAQRMILRKQPDGVRELTEHLGAIGNASAIGQQSVFVLNGLLRATVHSRLHGSASEAESVRGALQQWVVAQGATEPVVRPDPLAADARLRTQRFPDEATLTALGTWDGQAGLPTPAAAPNQATGAVAAARAALVGLHADTPAAAAELGISIGVLTHGHPDGYLPAAAAAAMVAALGDGQTLAESVQSALTELKAWEGSENTVEALQQALELAERGPIPARALESLGSARTGPSTLGSAVAAALAHPESFADAVALAATHSGDSAATAALCGSLLGAARGADAVPQRWLDELELGDLLAELLADARRAEEELVEGGPVPEWAQRYTG